MKSNTLFPTIIIAVSIIFAMFIMSNAVINRNRTDNSISVTGMAERNFVSDLIVWKSTYSVKNNTMTQAYAELKDQTQKIQAFLISKGIKAEELTFSAVDISKDYQYINTNGGTQTVFDGYRLTQTVSLSSTEVERIEKISREITELINQGIEINSLPPQYFYTKLADLKIEMLAEATQDGKLRASTIAKNGGSKLGKLKNSSMGVFQIVALNSAEDYSWGGSFNTSSKNKTASVTVKLAYNIK